MERAMGAMELSVLDLFRISGLWVANPFYTSWMRRSRPTVWAARVRVCSVTEALPGSRRRSSAARLVFMRRAISTPLILPFSMAC